MRDDPAWLEAEYQRQIAYNQEAEQRRREQMREFSRIMEEQMRNKNRLFDQFQEYQPLDRQPKLDRPGFKQFKLPDPPAFFCVQYIGGPLNAQQKMLQYKEHCATIKEGVIYMEPIIEPVTFGAEGDPVHSVSHASYKLTFIPQNETTFAPDMQIVIALYQET
jgi:hypothetical protein